MVGMLFRCRIVWNHPLEHGQTTRAHSPKKIGSLFPSNYQLSIVPQLRGSYVPLPQLCWDGDWVNLMQVLCRQPQLLRMQQSCRVQCPVFLELWLYNHSAPSSEMFPGLLRERRFETGIPFMAEHSSDIFFLCVFTSCKTLC